jgi:hypothetical protein
MPETITRRRNWAPLIGLLFALAALFSNAVFFWGLPGQKIVPVLSLALAAVAVFCITLGIMRAFRQSEFYGGKVSSSILGVFAVVVAALAVFIFVGARKIPGAEHAPQVGQKAPDFTLADTSNNKVTLAQLLAGDGGGAAGAAGTLKTPKAVLLIFYRGYW